MLRTPVMRKGSVGTPSARHSAQGTVPMGLRRMVVCALRRRWPPRRMSHNSRGFVSMRGLLSSSRRARSSSSRRLASSMPDEGRRWTVRPSAEIWARRSEGLMPFEASYLFVLMCVCACVRRRMRVRARECVRVCVADIRTRANRPPVATDCQPWPQQRGHHCTLLSALCPSSHVFSDEVSPSP